MSYSLYVTNLPREITLEQLLIYFSSERHSGGGDLDNDACILNGDKAVVVFEKSEDLERVLRRKHEIDGYKLEISDTPIKTKAVSKKRTKMLAKEKESSMMDRAQGISSSDTLNQPEWIKLSSIRICNEKAYLGEIRTVIVSNLGPDTTNESVKMFFKNERRTGGGAIEMFERCQLDLAHITFASAEVASRVLQHDKLKLEGYLLKIVEKQPKLFLPLDKKKLYVENIDPKTSKDCLTNYIEVLTNKDVRDVQFGQDRNALIDLEEEPDLWKILENKKPLEGASLRISHPPVCNSILITGLSKDTTKQAIEMYFGNKKHGGGKIYGEIIHERDKGKAIVSFCDPNVVQALTTKKQKLNGSKLSIEKYYPFMKTFKETIKLNSDVVDHSISPQKFKNRFIVKEIPFSKKLLAKCKKELTKMITELTNYNCTVTIEEDLPQIKLVGSEKEVNEIFELVTVKIGAFEEELSVITKDIHLPEHKLRLFVHHDIVEMLKNKFNVEAEIKPQDENIRIKGRERQVFSAASLLYEKCAQIMEDIIELTEMKRRFLQSGGLENLNSNMKAKGLRGIIFLTESKANKVKVLAFDGTTVEDIHSFLSNNMFEQSYKLDDDNISLLRSNKWKEFYENVTKNTCVMMYSDTSCLSEITLIGKKSEVEQVFEELNEFMRQNIIISEGVNLGEGKTRFLTEFCMNDLEEIERKLEEHFVRVHVNEGRIIAVDGTKQGVKAAKKHLQDIVSSIARRKICFDNLRMQEYFESEEGKIFLAGIESAHECLIRQTKYDGTFSVKEEPFLEIYAKDNAIVDLAKGKIHKIMESQQKKKKIEDKNIDKLSKQQITEITRICKMSDIKVTIEKELNCIVLFGHSEDIKKTVATIYEILKRIGKEMKGKEKVDLHSNLAGTVSLGIQWFWMDPDNGDYVAYDKHTNATIERAFNKKDKSVIFLFDKKICEISFDKMEEKNLKTNETANVTREVLEAEVSVPEYWEPQPRDRNGNELAEHNVFLYPNNPRHKDEYKRVSDHFLQRRKVRIHQIQRIQNPALFKQYMMKKKSLDEKRGTNEKLLFHENALNRNYAGLYGNAFGKGVYFARDASLLAGSALEGPATNEKYLYLARVAVGEYTYGDQSMLRPPHKEDNLADWYDSTVNNTTTPTIFVTYDDNQFYLEYLIIFS